MLLVLLALLAGVVSAEEAAQRAEPVREAQEIRQRLADLKESLAVLERLLAAEPPRPRIVQTARQQCAGMTRKRARCSRMASQGKTTCWQHTDAAKD